VSSIFIIKIKEGKSMAVFKPGTYGEIQANGFTNAANADSQSAIVYIGTAPVNQIEGGAANELPATGLEDMRPKVTDIFSKQNLNEEIAAEPRMSRPKTEEAPEENGEGTSGEAPESTQEEAADAA
jgi:hypothetical protein